MLHREQQRRVRAERRDEVAEGAPADVEPLADGTWGCGDAADEEVASLLELLDEMESA